jgi:hypothetical protein
VVHLTVETAQIEETLSGLIREDITSFSPYNEPNPIDQDPLGAAFYSLLMARYGYSDPYLDSLADGLRYWAEEKISGGHFSPYLDRDITALCLALYSFKKGSDRSLSPDSASRLNEILGRHFRESDGFFADIFETALIGTSLRALLPASELTRKCCRFLKDRFHQKRDVIFNDGKTAYAYFLFGCETQDSRLVRDVAMSAFEKIREAPATLAPQDTVYFGLAAIEGFDYIDRQYKKSAREILANSLRAARGLVQLSESPQEVSSVYGEDRGRPSRVLLAAAEALAIKFRSTPFSWYESDAGKSVLRGVLYIAGWTLIFLLVSFVLHLAGIIPRPTKLIALRLTWGNWSNVAAKVGSFCVVVAYIQLCALYLILCCKLFRNMVWLRNNQDWLFTEAWETYRKHFVPSLVLGIIGAAIQRLVLG